MNDQTYFIIFIVILCLIIFVLLISNIEVENNVEVNNEKYSLKQSNTMLNMIFGSKMGKIDFQKMN